MAEIRTLGHVTAVCTRNTAERIIPCKRRKAMLFPFSIDQEMNALFKLYCTYLRPRPAVTGGKSGGAGG